MDIDRLQRWLSLCANIAIIGGIIFLAIEIRQNTEITRAQITQSRADTAVFFAESIVNSDYMPDIYEKIDKNQALNFQENIRYQNHLRASLRNQQNNYMQYQDGFLRDYIPRATELAILNILSDEIALEYWDNNKYSYSDEFIELVDQAIEKNIE
jgi:hypothetical protein